MGPPAPFLTAWCGGPGADHGRKHETGDETVTRGLDVRRPVTEALPCHLQSRRWCSKRRRQCGQQRSTRVSAATMRRRMAGRLGARGGPGSAPASVLFPPEPQVLQEGEGQQAQQRVVVQPAPGAALEVVQPQLVLELL